MGKQNQYLTEKIPALYRRSIMDVMIYTFIDTQRFTIPTISVEESCRSFMSRHKICEDQMSLESIKSTYFRIQKEILHGNKS